MELDERLADPQVKLASARLHEAAVCGLPNEAVPEAVFGRGQPAFLDEELEPLELRQGRSKLRAG